MSEHYKSLGLFYYDIYIYIYVYWLGHIRTTAVVIGRLIIDVCGHCNIRIEFKSVYPAFDYEPVYDRRPFERVFSLYEGWPSKAVALLLCDYCIALLSRLDLGYTFFSLLLQCYSRMIITCHYSHWSCVSFINYAFVLAVYLVYWCIGTDPYPVGETEGQTSQAFEPVDEPEWRAEDGYKAVWICAWDIGILDTFSLFNSIIYLVVV